jgi:hypothetical protein
MPTVLLCKINDLSDKDDEVCLILEPKALGTSNVNSEHQHPGLHAAGRMTMTVGNFTTGIRL